MQKVPLKLFSRSSHIQGWIVLSLQQEAQPQNSEEESSEEFEHNAQTESLRQDSKTSCHPQAWPCGKSLIS